MKFTLMFIFNHTLDAVILMEKNRGYYIGQLNGVGGKIDAGDPDPEHAALRELAEEAGITREQLTVFEFLATVIFANREELYVYYGVLAEENDFVQMEDEPLMWVPVVETTDVTDARFAGDGSVCYYINFALKLMKDGFPYDM